MSGALCPSVLFQVGLCPGGYFLVGLCPGYKKATSIFTFRVSVSDKPPQL